MKLINSDIIDSVDFHNGKPIISIVTIVKNGAKTLEKTIKSVIEQDYCNIQYIVIDGGSNDGSVKIIKKYNNIDYWISEPDEGISDAFNKGIKKAKGKIVGTINSDDWYENNIISDVARIYDEKDPDVLVGKMKYWSGNVPDYIYDARPEKLEKEMTVNHQASFIKRSIYERYGFFDEKCKYAMDYELMLRLKLKNCKFYVADKTIANMQLKGISDRNWGKAFYESREIKMKLTGRKIEPILYYYFQVVRKFVSRIMDIFGLQILKRIFRARFSIVRKKYCE